MPRSKVLVADDHAIVAQGLGSLLQNEFEVVGIVNDGRELVEATRQTRSAGMPSPRWLVTARAIQSPGGIPIGITPTRLRLA